MRGEVDLLASSAGKRPGKTHKPGIGGGYRLAILTVGSGISSNNESGVDSRELMLGVLYAKSN